MLDIPTLVSEATFRAHLAHCPDHSWDSDCEGPNQVEMMITAFVLESTLPKILGAISQEFNQVLHAMGTGNGTPGEPDALGEDPDELVAEWFRWWHAQDLSLLPAKHLHTRTAAYLAARRVQQGLPVRSTADF